MHQLIRPFGLLIALLVFPDIVLAQVPQLVCAGGIGTTPDEVNFSLDASCSKNGNQSDTQSKYIRGWVTNPNLDSTTASCPHTNLAAQSRAAVAHTCIGLSDGAAQLIVGVEAQGLAGWDRSQSCDGGNYCSASAAARGSAATTFSISAEQVNKYCMGVVSFTGIATGTKGYEGSKWFTPGVARVNTVVFSNPNNQTLALASGATYLLNVPGTWRILIPEAASISSNMSETSGTYIVTQVAIVKFDEAYANQKCPAPQLSQSGKSKVIAVPLPKTTVSALRPPLRPH